ncbi:hypothetical protein [Staphylococcus equorum]|uniref:hypothetical protein n=1 Tax=Staphylococcus equorum TaxID=246432 RepID=UPI0008537DC2|nr:hypothetical protein [Staphylococcus equorum]OEK76474.1 hypothetical protein AST05_08005 [Staphylococcus equorum]
MIAFNIAMLFMGIIALIVTLFQSIKLIVSKNKGVDENNNPKRRLKVSCCMLIILIVINGIIILM